MSPNNHVRPKSVTLLALGVLSIALFNLLGLLQIVQNESSLRSYFPFTLEWLGLLRLFWACTGIALAWGFFFGRTWAFSALRPAVIAYLVWYWLERYLFFTQAGRGDNIVFLAVVSLLVVIVVFWILSAWRVKKFFGVINE